MSIIIQFTIARAKNKGRITVNTQEPVCMNIWAVKCDFQQCGILTSVDSDELVLPPFKLRDSRWCAVSSLTLIDYSTLKILAKALIRLRICTGCSEALLVAHTILLEFSWRIEIHLQFVIGIIQTLLYEINSLNAGPLLGNFSCFCCRLLTFFKIDFFKKILSAFSKKNSFRNVCTYYKSVKWFRSRSGPTFYQSWSGSRLFAKIKVTANKERVKLYRRNWVNTLKESIYTVRPTKKILVFR